MQGVEHRVRFRVERGDHSTEIGADFDRLHVVARVTQCGDHLRAAGETHLAFGGDTAIEDRDALQDTISVRGAGVPMRLISHSSVMPLVACTRRRTSSPRPSRSAAVASPVLSRKLQCFSLILGAAARQTAALRGVDQFPGARFPGGLRKVEPPVRARTGWVAGLGWRGFRPCGRRFRWRCRGVRAAGRARRRTRPAGGEWR